MIVFLVLLVVGVLVCALCIFFGVHMAYVRRKEKIKNKDNVTIAPGIEMGEEQRFGDMHGLPVMGYEEGDFSRQIVMG